MPEKTLHFPSPRHLLQLYANREDNLFFLEKRFNARLTARDGWLKIEASEKNINQVETLIKHLDQARAQGLHIRTPDLHRFAEKIAQGAAAELRELLSQPLVINTRRKTIIPKTLSQKLYLQSIQEKALVFGIGPAGTGKTYLAVAAAISALLKNEVERIILTRPAVEAGEELGFLPGDLREKILPYLRPLYDAMHDMLPPEEITALTEKGIIEIAPLAYMRGRTLTRALIILDEAQNTTSEQMMMFLTRLGEDSRMIVTGDITQIDLPAQGDREAQERSGLVHALHVLHGVPGIGFCRFQAADVVRHPLVGRIVNAYQAAGGAQ